jgi:hypothetical protein
VAWLKIGEFVRHAVTAIWAAWAADGRSEECCAFAAAITDGDVSAVVAVLVKGEPE